MFDERAAVGIAMHTFWRTGFQATSLDDLTAAMNINRPSMYAAFGDKSKLFCRCLANYQVEFVSVREACLDQDKPWPDVIGTYLRDWVRVFTDSSMPGGCFLASHIGAEGIDDTIQNDISVMAQSTHRRIAGCLARQKSAVGLLGSESPTDLARTILCFLSGASAMSRIGTSRRQLLASVSSFVSMLHKTADCEQ